MEKQTNKAASEGYPLTISKDVLELHVVDQSEIDCNLGDTDESLALVNFDGKTLPCLIESELFYNSEEQIIHGTVFSHLPRLWQDYLRPKHEIITELDHYLQLPGRLTNGCISIQRHDYIDVYIESGERLLSAWTSLNPYDTIELKFELFVNPEDSSSKYDDLVSATNFWGTLHDFVADSGETDGVPVRYIDGDPNHRIYVGGTSEQALHHIEPVFINAFDAYQNDLASDVPLPRLHKLNFNKINEATLEMTTYDVVQAIKRAIASKRNGYHQTGDKGDLYTVDILAAIFE